MIEYKVISEYTKSNLVLEVNNSLREGWKLAGGVSVSVLTPRDTWYCQALTRDLGTLTTTTWKPEPSVTGKPAVTDIYGNPVPDPRWAKLNEKDGTWPHVITEIPVPDPVAPKSDEQKLIDVLTEIGIPHQTDRGNKGYSWVDLTYEGTADYDSGDFTTVNFKNGKYTGID